MDDINKLANQLLKALETKRGCSVQITADTPNSVRYLNERCKGREYFGKFKKRQLEVKRIRGLPSKYEHDVALLEGDYKNFRALEKKVERLNILYEVLHKTADKAREILRPQIDQGNLELAEHSELNVTPLYHAFNKKQLKRASKILDKAGITHLYHNIKAKSDGLFEDRTFHEILDETKIANIILELI